MFIPESVEKNYNLSPNEKYLFGLILQNVDNNGICDKPNSFFASFFGNNFGVTERTIRNYLNKLKAECLISISDIGKLKKAIIVVNPVMYKKNTTEKNMENQVVAEIVSKLEKFFQNLENKPQNKQFSDPILSIIYDLFNLVLVSKENKNIYNNSACARVNSVSNNLNTFANYESAGKPDRVPYFDFETRKPFTHVLFKDFFEFQTSGQFFETGKEVVDVMLTAYEKSKTKEGFKFNHKTWHKNDMLDLFYNITSDEFASIVSNATLKEDIHARNCYIIGAVIHAGTKIDWKKTNKLVSQGYPWDCFVPGQKMLHEIVVKTQQRIQREKQNLQFAKEFAYMRGANES